MGIFTSKAVADPGTSESYEARRYRQVLSELDRLDAELAAAGKAVADFRSQHKDLRVAIINGRAVVPVDAMKKYPALQELEYRRNTVLQERNALLAEYADLKFKLGLGR